MDDKELRDAWQAVLQKYVIAGPIVERMSRAVEVAGRVATPTVGQVSEEQVLEVVKDAVKLALARHDLLADIDDTISRAEEIAEDTWLAMNGKGTCDEGRIPSLNALLRTQSAQSKERTDE